jgi:toxin HigB-1
MIQSFTCRDTEHLFTTEKSRRWSSIVRVTLRKLIQLNQAGMLSDMAVPPGNRLEALKGNFSGFHSIRINAQWRIIFKWSDSGPAEVAIVDYH